MSYEAEMKYCTHTYNPKTNKYEADEHSYLDLPLSKMPIEKKLFRAIMERRSFSNLKSTVRTAIRWEGEYYIVSMIVWDRDTRKNKEMDIAVGRQGKVPFIFRPAFANDPTLDTLVDPVWNSKKQGWEYPVVKVDPKQRYSACHEQGIATRLDQLQCICCRSRTAVGTIINPKTKRKNKIYASVPHIRVNTLTNDEFEIGSDWWDLLRKSAGLPKLTGSKLSDKDYMEQNERINSDDFWNHIEWKPLFKRAWYFRNGTIASEDQSDKIKL